MNHLIARRTSTALAGLALLGLAGCDSIGDGSTIRALEIQTTAGTTETPFRLHSCLRDQLVAIATFDDGTRANYSGRVTWTSSDPATVAVSSGDLPQVIVEDGEFLESPDFNYVPGIVVPRAASGTARITAQFLGFTATRDVELYTPTAKIAPLVPGIDPQVQPPAVRHLLKNTVLRYAYFAVTDRGQTLTSTALNSAALNPVIWEFVGGTFVAADPDVPADFDKHVVPDATNPTLAVATLNGAVTALDPDAATYTVAARTSICEDPSFTPVADVGVAPLATTNPLELRHEANFNGPGSTTGDLVGGTNEQLVVIANLDTDGDGAGDTTQDLSTQVQLDLDHLTSCTQGTTNCTCESNGTGCTKRLMGTTQSTVLALSSTDFADASVTACFKENDEDTTHSDDCSETSPTISNALVIRLVPVDLTTAAVPPFVDPAPTAERAFTYPGFQFDTYATFTANTAQLFAGSSTTGTQKINRQVGWTTRPEGSTTEFSDLAFLTAVGDGLFGPLHTFIYLKDVTTNTVVDNYMVLGAPFTGIAAPTTPFPFTICPSDAASCP